jgi:hypothetical protein
MNPEPFLANLWAAINQHLQLPAQFSWAPNFGVATLALGGLLLMIRGARWARGLGGIGFTLIGGLAGKFIAEWIGTPLWPTVGVTAVVSLIVSVLFFRLWQAAVLAGVCLAAGLGAYYVFDLAGPVATWIGDGQKVTLRPAGAAATDGQTWWAATSAEAQSLWAHLSATAPNFQFNFWAISIGASLLGLTFGAVFPRGSRALWAATIGTVCTGVGATGLLQVYAPEAYAWLLANNLYSWGIVGIAWAASLAYNLINTAERPAKTGEPDAPPGTMAMAR